MLVNNVKWYIKTCHECQIHQIQKLHIPPTVLVVGRLFHKVHINTMAIPWSGGYQFIIQAWCTLMAYLEWQMLWSENASVITSFIFEDILCHWGAVSELVTDNGTLYIQALNIPVNWYGIHHIWISPYNSQVNGMVEWCHYNVWEAIVKSSLGGEVCWPLTAHFVFWAECVLWFFFFSIVLCLFFSIPLITIGEDSVLQMSVIFLSLDQLPSSSHVYNPYLPICYTKCSKRSLVTR